MGSKKINMTNFWDSKKNIKRNGFSFIQDKKSRVFQDLFSRLKSYHT